MLDTFYKLNEWDLETSWQTQEGLKKIELVDVAEHLKKVGKLK